MTAKQISVFLENKAGRLHDATRILGEAGINIRALLVADTRDYGVLRMIVDDPDKAYEVLKQNDFTVQETDVLAVEVTDKPGGLARVLGMLTPTDINVEYLYCFIAASGDKAIVVLRVEDPEKAAGVLAQAGIKVLSGEQIYK